MRFREALGFFLLLFSISAEASFSSYRNANPIGWMHLLPVGETPGWSTGTWFDIELNQANIWNKRFDMTDKRTGDTYTYEADFEQTSTILDMGGAFGKWVALGVELPYVSRSGGVFDDFIDQFHQTIGSSRFMRNTNHAFGEHFRIETNGVNRIVTDRTEGLGNWKLKLKTWLWRWNSPTPGACDCGFATSLQAKFPFQHWERGLSSGGNDYSGLLHLGAPIGQYSGAWATAGFTKLGRSPAFEGWPKREWLQMYELSLNLAFGPHWSVILQARTESPLFMKEYLDFNYSYPEEDPESRDAERIASGWNGMMHWRGSESIGLRRRWGQGSHVSLLLIEDWGTGRYDNRGDWLYVNNAPDVEFVLQMHFVF